MFKNKVVYYIFFNLGNQETTFSENPGQLWLGGSASSSPSPHTQKNVVFHRYQTQLRIIGDLDATSVL